MAELEDKTKSRGSITPWLLLGIGIITVLFLLTRQSNDKKGRRTVITTSTVTSTSSHVAKHYWNTVVFDAPPVNYNEITDRDIYVRGTNDYTIYSLREEVLFDKGTTTLRTGAVKALQQLANSIEQRYTNGLVRIYEQTNCARNDKAIMQLMQQRTETVRNWLSQNGNIAADHITLNPAGKSWPISTTKAREDHKLNQQLAIVAKRFE